MIRKSIILSCILIFCAPFVSYSQKGLELGIHYMPQNTWLFNQSDFDEAESLLSHDYTWDEAYGLSAGINLSDGFGIGTNVLYSTQGQQYYGNLNDFPEPEAYSYQVGFQKFITMDVLGTEYTAEVNLEYLQMPVFLKFNSNPDRIAFFSFLIGPQFNFMTKARHLLNGEEVNYQEVSQLGFDTKELYNTSTMAVTMGLGLNISLSSSLKFNLNTRLTHDVDDIENKEFTYSSLNLNYWGEDRQSTHNMTAGLMAGLTYVFCCKRQSKGIK